MQTIEVMQAMMMGELDGSIDRRKQLSCSK